MLNKEKIELAATTYADKRCSAWTNDYDGFIAGAYWCQQNLQQTVCCTLPSYPKFTGKEIIDKLSLLNEGDFIELSYSDYSKQHIRHCIYNANINISRRGLILKTASVKTGCGIWVFAK